jgi:glycosyltransferase involved in cell wall biosynthesis
MPQKLLNYMAAGKPIVSFEGSAVNLEHKKTGWIVENGNIPGFANAILQLLDDSELAKKLGENARKYVASEFTWEKTAERVEAVYEQTLKVN